jgi:hypothetical protein
MMGGLSLNYTAFAFKITLLDILIGELEVPCSPVSAAQLHGASSCSIKESHGGLEAKSFCVMFGREKKRFQIENFNCF